MRLAAIYDIHGNLPALEAVVADIRRAGVDEVVVGGDVVPGPMPVETIAFLRDIGLPLRCLHGNGEREVLAARAGTVSEAIPPRFREVIRWTADQLDPDDARWLESWPSTVTAELPGIGPVLFCHATPRSDTDIFTRLTPEAVLLPLFSDLAVNMVVCGHTHMQFDRTVGRIRIMNAGSVGMPFGPPAAYWALLGPAVELRYTRYDLDRAAERVRASAYPDAEEFAARNILMPPSEDTMLEAFTRAGVAATARAP